LNPQQLWDLTLNSRDVLSQPPHGYWRIDPDLVMTKSSKKANDRTWCNRGGYVRGFESIFDPQGFALLAEEIRQFDPLVHWVLHTAREALRDAKCLGNSGLQIGAILGNLSYPSHSLNQYSESIWLDNLGPGFLNGKALKLAGVSRPNAINRFSSGLPAHILARALSLSAGAFALDAACASSLYAVKLACDQLHEGRADLMLAGGINRADDLIIHIGFCLLQAMSRSGRSRPFDRYADGLVPCEGAGFIVLKRLEDALTAGDRILGIIRAVGLSNDGSGQGILVPSRAGQLRAIRRAYKMSGLRPADISLVEGHATGTRVGDRVEIQSMSQVYQGLKNIPIGTIKSNMGHPITASGIAGLIKVLGAMKAGIRPPTLHVQHPIEELKNSPFRLITKPEEWAGESPRRAAINNFGFGGCNAHLIVEEWDPCRPAVGILPKPADKTDIAIVGMGTIVADAATVEDFSDAVFSGTSRLRRHKDGSLSGYADPFDLPLLGAKFSPADLDQALAQQLLILKAAMNAIAEVGRLSAKRTAVMVGMGCDAEAARSGMCWRLEHFVRKWIKNGWTNNACFNDLSNWLSEARDHISPLREAGSIIGAMPNIPASRISSQFDLAGPSFTVSSEELSGLRCLDLAMRSLRCKELDAAVVGAVDLCCEPVHRAAAKEVLDEQRQIPGDAAVVLILKRLEDARHDDDKIYAIVTDDNMSPEPDLRLGLGDGYINLTPLFGHAHAASGLVHTAAAALACYHGVIPVGAGGIEHPRVAPQKPGSALVGIHALGGEFAKIRLVADHRTDPTPFCRKPIPSPYDCPGKDGGQDLQNAWKDKMPDTGPARPAGSRQNASYTASRTYAAHPPEITLPPLVLFEQKEPADESRMKIGLEEMITHHLSLSRIHQDYLAQQSQIHQRFLESRRSALNSLGRAVDLEIDVTASDAGSSMPPGLPEVARKVSHNNASLPDFPILNSAPGEPCGPTFSREQLEILASGKISEVFGPLFIKQDGYRRQVRLPEPPLLLTDRVTGLDAKQGSMGKGTIWTETDVDGNAWYMNDGYMPPGITVEAGQSDLLLISWLGVDFLNQSKRVYRLLGCDLVYFGTPPKAGDTLRYEIHVDGHTNVGDVRIFFFHYDCRIDGQLRLSVRDARAGFFTDQELADSGGVLWEPETAEVKADARLDPPAVHCTRSEFSIHQVRAFSEGRVYECFGPGFEITATHSKSPKIQSGQMLLLDRVTHFDPIGGPWNRGYLRVENQIPPDAWYLICHFKNDPCMPGTLMSDACLQAMSFYLAAMGYTLNKDGWRFEPVPDKNYQIKCRGQVVPGSKQLSYEVFVEEIIDGPYPTVYADILGICDGLKILHIRRMGLRLVPDWPLDRWPHFLERHIEKKTAARLGDMEFNYKSMLACAFGRPSEAFGALGRPFDNGKHIARLPGPPYHFMTRVTQIEAQMGAMKTGEAIEVEYDVPCDAWYFERNGNRTMPFCVLMEVALQPCGWLAVFEGVPLTTEDALYFRNLDGSGSINREILPDMGTICTRATLTHIFRISGAILVNFDVQCFVGEDSVYQMETGFGFFSKKALDQQPGLPTTDAQRAWLDEPCDFLVDLTKEPEHFFAGELRLPRSMLLMLDQVTGFWPQGGRKAMGRLRAEKSVNISEWFFKAHFFQDPVQPGSLGVESIIQLLQFYMLHKNMHDGLDHPRFMPIALNSAVTWTYRGQVTPDKKRITVEMDIVGQGRDAQGVYATAEAWLWADRLRIFHVRNLKIHIVSSKPPEDFDTDNRLRIIPDRDDLQIKAQVARHLKLEPADLNLVEGRNAAVCKAMPLNLFPLEEHGKNLGQPVLTVGDARLDFNRIFSCFRRLLDTGPWIGEDVAKGLCNTFIRHLKIEDPKAFDNIKHRSALYLGNHQVQIESILFPILAQVLTGSRIVTIADANHRTGSLGHLNDLLFTCPGVNNPQNIIYFNRNNRQSMFNIIEGLKSAIADHGISVFLHVEGKLGLSCRNPVTGLSSVFVDLALDANLPIVPVRFVGGLPIAQLEVTLDFPVGYCKQDYYVGRPIMPDELRALNYAQRRKLVVAAINNLGPSNQEEVPGVPNLAFGKAVKDWVNKTGATEFKAVLFKVIDALTSTSAEETRDLIMAACGDRTGLGYDAKGRWLSEMADWLFTPTSR
jgi:3-oxoacyl-(acyl-carrier-protein) synthase/3-hydroxymyristoyl/3-hydroxydecanoyl-(acyl carrier protein) dehydratase